MGSCSHSPSIWDFCSQKYKSSPAPDIPRVRTGIEKVPYWPVYGIKMLARMGVKSRSSNA